MIVCALFFFINCASGLIGWLLILTIFFFGNLAGLADHIVGSFWFHLADMLNQFLTGEDYRTLSNKKNVDIINLSTS